MEAKKKKKTQELTPTTNTANSPPSSPVPADVVANIIWVHLRRSGEGLEGLWVQSLVKETLAMEVEEKGQSLIGCSVITGQQACFLVVEDG